MPDAEISCHSTARKKAKTSRDHDRSATVPLQCKSHFALRPSHKEIFGAYSANRRHFRIICQIREYKGQELLRSSGITLEGKGNCTRKVPCGSVDCSYRVSDSHVLKISRPGIHAPHGELYFIISYIALRLQATVDPRTIRSTDATVTVRASRSYRSKNIVDRMHERHERSLR
jgi:hypothetical protein